MEVERCFYSVKEFAKMLSISDQGIRKMIRENKIKSIKLTDSKTAKLRIPASELLRLQSEAYGEEHE